MGKSGKIHCAIVGYGYWGPNLARNLRRHPDCSGLGFFDQAPDRVKRGGDEFPGALLYETYDEVLDSKTIDAVVIATPVSTHFDLARRALLAGKHVLVEKPMTFSVDEACELRDLAKRKGRVLMVDHTFVYHPAVLKIKEILASGALGRIRYIDSTRINLGIFQHDVNVLWDLAVHDISIIQFLMEETPEWVQATGMSHTLNEIENIGYLILKYPSGLLAHINCSWISPVKIRHMLIGGEKKMIVYDDLNGGEPVKVYDSGFVAKNHEDVKQFQYAPRIGDIYSPRIEVREALANLTDDFMEAVLRGKRPVSDADFGVSVVQILDRAQKSIKTSGAPVFSAS